MACITLLQHINPAAFAMPPVVESALRELHASGDRVWVWSDEAVEVEAWAARVGMSDRLQFEHPSHKRTP